MKCLRCGHCCFHYMVVIVKPGIIPTGEITDADMLTFKPSDEYCPHFEWESEGVGKCIIHDEPFFKYTPCHRHKQVEYEESDCRSGEYFNNPKNIELKQRLCGMNI